MADDEAHPEVHAPTAEAPVSDATRVPPLHAYVAERLSGASEELVDEWLEELDHRLGVRPSRLLPSEDLRDHFPSVLRHVAESLLVPVEPVRFEGTGRLRELAQLRRDQGYDIEELLIEFAELNRRVLHRFRELVDSYPARVALTDVADVSIRLHDALDFVARVTVTTYRREEAEQKRELGKKIAEYTTAITHQLKNPLSAATTSAEMLRLGELGQEEIERFSELVMEGLKRMDSLIEDIRTLVLDDGSSDGRRIQLRQAVERVLDEVRGRAADRGVALEVQGEIPEVEVDAGQVEIALINLVANGVKYCDPGKAERWVRLAVRPADTGSEGERWWTIRVADNGLGIPEQFHDQVFERHFRAHPTVAEGTGLGLSLTHDLVTRRGSVDFESAEGQGTTFMVTVPERPKRGEE